MIIHDYFRQKWGCVAIEHLLEARTPRPHICFLAIGHIIGFLVETILLAKNS
jgi:hypothetical protein